MSIEIERKYLVAKVPASIEASIGKSIRQGYVIAVEGGIELRVRQKGERFFQTIKMGEGLSRTEIEIERVLRYPWASTRQNWIASKGTYPDCCSWRSNFPQSMPAVALRRRRGSAAK